MPQTTRVKPTDHAPQDGPGGAGVGVVIDGRGGQHGDQAQGVDGRGQGRADAAVEGRQHRQDDAADRRQGQADDMDPEIGQPLGAGLVVIDHVEGVWRADVLEQSLQAHPHASFKARNSSLVPAIVLEEGDSRLNPAQANGMF